MDSQGYEVHLANGTTYLPAEKIAIIVQPNSAGIGTAFLAGFLLGVLVSGIALVAREKR